MHCSSCGKSIAQVLSYCNHCGARVTGPNERDDSRLSEASLNLLLGGILGIPIVGIGLLIGLMSVMTKEIGFSNGLTAIFTAVGFLLFLAAEIVFIWMLVNRSRKSKELDRTQLKDVVTKELGERQARELPEPAVSITDSTTRALEHVHREKKKH